MNETLERLIEMADGEGLIDKLAQELYEAKGGKLPGPWGSSFNRWHEIRNVIARAHYCERVMEALREPVHPQPDDKPQQG